jgi:hypothetical protein
MTDTQILPGNRLGNFQVLAVDETGKRISVSCACGHTNIVGIEALLSGTATCPAVNAIGHKSRP